VGSSQPHRLPKICLQSSGNITSVVLNTFLWASVPTKLRSALRRITISPFFAQQVAWSPNKLIGCLHKGQGILIQDRNSEAISDGGSKDSRAQQSIFAIFTTWNCSDESTSVWLSCTSQALRSASVSDQPNICASFIELKRGILL